MKLTKESKEFKELMSGNSCKFSKKLHELMKTYQTGNKARHITRLFLREINELDNFKNVKEVFIPNGKLHFKKEVYVPIQIDANEMIKEERDLLIKDMETVSNDLEYFGFDKNAFRMENGHRFADNLNKMRDRDYKQSEQKIEEIDFHSSTISLEYFKFKMNEAFGGHILKDSLIESHIFIIHEFDCMFEEVKLFSAIKERFDKEAGSIIVNRYLKNHSNLLEVYRLPDNPL